MIKDQLFSMGKYNYNMNQKIYVAASRLSDEERNADKGAFFKSVQGTLQHIMVADLAWLKRFQSISKTSQLLERVNNYPAISDLDGTIYPNFPELKMIREKLDSLIGHFIEILDEDDIASKFTFKDRAGKEHTSLLWVYLTHLFNHQTHHRGQVTTLLTQTGIDIGITDLPVVLRENL